MVEKLKLNGRGHSTNRNVYHLFYVWACLYNWGLRNVWGPILENQLEWMSGDLHYYLYSLEFRSMVSSLVNPILWCIRSHGISSSLGNPSYGTFNTARN